MSIARLSVLVLVGIVVVVAGAEHEEDAGGAAPYGGSYQIEDTCQFSLCGPLYRQEFGVGRRPLAGSCSGDCHLLAINTNTNRFTKEFLWSHCATMCSTKYNTTEFSSYKPRFSCMSSCYSMYSPLSPHHNLARYCIQASCPHTMDQDMFQLDCFSQCSSHVSTSVSPPDWEEWARALAGECQEDKEEGRTHKLRCADSHIWHNTISLYPNLNLSTMANHCMVDVCEDNLKCARNCLDHVLEVAKEKDRSSLWLSCSLSAECSSPCRPAVSCSNQRLGCADDCVQRELIKTTTTISTRGDSGGKLARLASNSGVEHLNMKVVVKVIMMMLFLMV